MTSILAAADSQPQSETPAETADDDDDDDDGNRECSPCLVAASVSGEPLRGDVTVTSPGDSRELRTHRVPETADCDAAIVQSGSAVMSSGGRNRETSRLRDRSENGEVSETAVSSGVDAKIRSKAASGDARIPRNAGKIKSGTGRICSDCRTGPARKIPASSSGDGTRRWNSPASSAAARNQRGARSTVRASVGDQPARRSRLSEDAGRRIASASHSNRQQRPVNDKQPRRRENFSQNAT